MVHNPSHEYSHNTFTLTSCRKVGGLSPPAERWEAHVRRQDLLPEIEDVRMQMTDRAFVSRARCHHWILDVHPRKRTLYGRLRRWNSESKWPCNHTYNVQCMQLSEHCHERDSMFAISKWKVKLMRTVANAIEQVYNENRKERHSLRVLDHLFCAVLGEAYD